MNKSQRLILASATPVLGFLAALAWATELPWEGRYIGSTWTSYAFEWLMVFTIVGLFEFWLFKDA